MSLIYLTTLLATSLTWIPSNEASAEDNVIIPYLWRNIEFVFPTDADQNNALRDGSYVIDNAVLNDVDVWEGKRICSFRYWLEFNFRRKTRSGNLIPDITTQDIQQNSIL